MKLKVSKLGNSQSLDSLVAKHEEEMKKVKDKLSKIVRTYEWRMKTVKRRAEIEA